MKIPHLKSTGVGMDDFNIKAIKLNYLFNIIKIHEETVYLGSFFLKAEAKDDRYLTNKTSGKKNTQCFTVHHASYL